MITPFPVHTEALQRSWGLIEPAADEFAELFYARLFELDPSLRSLFHVEPAVQRQKLMDMLGFLVKHAGVPDELLPTLRALGSRHVAYGVTRARYAIAGEALIWTLDQGLGMASPETRAAWVAMWEHVSEAMSQPAAISLSNHGDERHAT
jgi:hemoglobin-like flavoprotein